MRPAVGPLVLLVLLPLGTAAAAEPWRPFAEAAPRMVPELTKLAAWCAEEKLNRERSEVFEAILVYAFTH